MRDGQDKDDDVQDQVGECEREVEREHHNAVVFRVLGFELLPQYGWRGALEGQGEDVGDAPGSRQADDDVVDEDEDADAEDPAEEEEHGELDEAQSGGPDHFVRIPRLLVDVELRRMARLPVLIELLMTA